MSAIRKIDNEFTHGMSPADAQAFLEKYDKVFNADGTFRGDDLDAMRLLHYAKQSNDGSRCDKYYLLHAKVMQRNQADLDSLYTKDLTLACNSLKKSNVLKPQHISMWFAAQQVVIDYELQRSTHLPKQTLNNRYKRACSYILLSEKFLV